jgi:hypothetical protein
MGRIEEMDSLLFSRRRMQKKISEQKQHKLEILKWGDGVST